MSYTLSVYQRAEWNFGEADFSKGSLSTPTEVTVDGRTYSLDVDASTGATTTLWTTSTAFADWDFLYIQSNYDVILEFAADINGNSVLFAKILKANVPLMLMYDDAVSSASTSNFFGGTYDSTKTINRLRIRNDSGSTATIRGILIT